LTRVPTREADIEDTDARYPIPVDPNCPGLYYGITEVIFPVVQKAKGPSLGRYENGFLAPSSIPGSHVSAFPLPFVRLLLKHLQFS
jgi:hypothetical protein